MSQPSAAILIIGDEILSGRTRDANMHYLAGQLTEAGIALKEARVVSDDETAIVDAVKTLSSRYDYLFTSGGIGPTHDDITADCIAKAFDRTIDVRADARDLLAAYYEKEGKDFNEARQRMARIPEGATLIDNPVSVAPGFTLENTHVMAGVPSVFRAMVASVLPSLTGGAPLQSVTQKLLKGEGDVAAPLSQLAQDYPTLSIGSYPFQQDGIYGTNIVLRGTDSKMLTDAKRKLKEIFGDAAHE